MYQCWLDAKVKRMVGSFMSFYQICQSDCFCFRDACMLNVILWNLLVKLSVVSMATGLTVCPLDFNCSVLI